MIWAFAKKYSNSKASAERTVQKIFSDILRIATFCDLEISDEAVWIAPNALKTNIAPPMNLPDKNVVRGYGKIPKMAANV